MTNPPASAAENSPAPPNTVLVCLDMQPPFVRAVQDGERIRNRCAFAIAVAQRLSVPVIFTEQVPDKLGRTEPALLALASGAAVFPKTSFSAFGDERFGRALLEETNAEHLLLCGIETPICVYQTAIAALQHGLDVTLLTDAVGARRPEDARVCLDALARAGAHLLPSETVFYAVLQRASHPFFKEYTQLVKAYG